MGGGRTIRPNSQDFLGFSVGDIPHGTQKWILQKTIKLDDTIWKFSLFNLLLVQDQGRGIR
jgi:hypothetical protein